MIQIIYKTSQFSIPTITITITITITGANDAPMPPLSDKSGNKAITGKNGKTYIIHGAYKGYRTHKKRKGGKPIRDLWSAIKTARHMMDNLSVRWASDRQVMVAFTTKDARTKARANQKWARFLAWSPNDQKVIMKAAKEMFHNKVTATTMVLVKGGRKRRNFSRNTAQFSRRAA